MEFLTQLFDTADFPARWTCGRWTPEHGWLHILSDLGVWSAYVAIPCVLGYFLLRRRDLPFRKIFLLFGAFILACGTTHLMEAVIFWWPAYRLAALIKLGTALVSWATVFALVPIVPRVLAMRSPDELQREVEARRKAEAALRQANEELERRVAERTAELVAANATLRAFYDNAPVCMGVTEPTDDGDILHVYDNQVTCRLFNVEPGATANRRATELGATRATVSEWLDHYHESQRRQGPVHFEYRLDPPDGPRWYTASVAPVGLGPSGRPRFCYVSEDVTDRHLAAESLREADRRKDEFLATLAHELRNPLAPIRNALQIMRLAADDPTTVKQARELMDRQLGQLIRLVDDLLDVSRITRGRLELRKARVELAADIQQAVETSRPALDQNGHTLVVELPSEPVYLDADLTRLAQVFWNLLNNAAKYTEPGGRVWLKGRREGGEVVVTVRDTGVGIPAEAMPRLFTMFSQVDGHLERSQGGLGIGLALVRGLTEMHGGTVTAHSDGPGRGSEFVVRLPVAVAEATRPVEVASASGSGGRRRVLVVDDNRDSAASLSMVLALKGCDTRTAHDGLEAVEMAEAFRPHVVLLDIGLPRLNGYDACRRIRAEPWGRDMVIVATTGWGQDEDRRRSREAGFDHHLVKPIGSATLDDLLKSLPAVAPS